MVSIWDQKCVFSPSLICLDMCNIQSQVKELEDNNIQLLHVDILDGYFSPSMPLGFELVKQLKSKTKLLFDCHVMAIKPDYFIDELIDIGVEQINFHAENCEHIDYMLRKIKKNGIRAGIALKPATSLNILEYCINECDTVLLMLINPGYASSKNESQIKYVNDKILELRDIINKKGLNTKIEIDGRISPSNISCYGNEDVEYFVCGTTCINRASIKDSVSSLYSLRNQVLGIKEE